MPPLILHSYRRCPFAMRVRMVLEEKGLPYSVVEEDLKNPSAELLTLHPEGKVPLLIDGGEAIPESAIITEYLDEKFPEVRLMPEEALARARVRLWTYWASSLLKPDLDAFKYEWKELVEADRGALLIRLKLRLSELASALSDLPFLMGDALTLADIHVFPFYRQLQRSRPDFAELLRPAPQVDAWLNRLTSRPSFERVMQKPRGFLRGFSYPI